MTLNLCLMVLSIAFLGSVLAIPCAMRAARWLGAVDRPDQFRRIHSGAIPRLGGLGLAIGLAGAMFAALASGRLDDWASDQRVLPLALAALAILALGAWDDCRGLNPKAKLLGQALVVLILYAGGFRITRIELLGAIIPLSRPFDLATLGLPITAKFDPVSLGFTLAWFIACMNIWNLIDGMDGVASGVGVVAAGTFMLVAAYERNLATATLAAGLVGGLLGFLLYNWNPASVFLGDSGALLLGLILGVIGLDLTQHGPSSVPIIIPILAMGLPIADTAMAIVRRWLRGLPLSAADRRHVHHLLLDLGLSTRQAAFVLYVFSAGLCGIVLLCAASRSEALALTLGPCATAAFLLVLTSRRDELARLIADYREKRRRGQRERDFTRLAWETVQRIELCSSPENVGSVVAEALLRVAGGTMPVRLRLYGTDQWPWPPAPTTVDQALMSGHVALFRLREGCEVDIEVYLPSVDSPTEPDIALRTFQRIALAASQRLRRLAPQNQNGVGHQWDPLTLSDVKPWNPHPNTEGLLATH